MGDVKVRMTQIHRSYLETEYQVDYFTEYRDRTAKYSRHFDFAIGLGALGSGGAGLGILAQPLFAIPCAFLTSISVIMSIAKNNYDWHGKISKSQELMDFFRGIARQYKNLIDDLNYNRTLDDEMTAIYLKLRADFLNAPNYPYPKLNDKVSKKLEEIVSRRIDQTGWWAGD